MGPIQVKDINRLGLGHKPPLDPDSLISHLLTAIIGYLFSVSPSLSLLKVKLDLDVAFLPGESTDQLGDMVAVLR